jgi:hypothetical protein
MALTLVKYEDLFELISGYRKTQEGSCLVWSWPTKVGAVFCKSPLRGRFMLSN